MVNFKELEENELLKRYYDLRLFSTQALTNDKVYLLVLYMGDGGGDQIISIHMKGKIYIQNSSME